MKLQRCLMQFLFYIIGLLTLAGGIAFCVSTKTDIPLVIDMGGKIVVKSSPWWIMIYAVLPLCYAFIYNLISVKAKTGSHFCGVNFITLGAQVLFILIALCFILMAKCNVSLEVGDNFDFPYYVIIVFFTSIWFAIIAKQLINVEPNYYFGVRNKYTLSNYEVWDKTQLFASNFYIMSSFIMLAMCVVARMLRLPLICYIGIVVAVVLALVPAKIYAKKIFMQLNK